MTVWISQWLCPERHCAIALAWPDEEANAAEAEKKGEHLFTVGVVNRWCGICHGALHVEHDRTVFKTMQEATPLLSALEREQMRTRAELDAHRN